MEERGAGHFTRHFTQVKEFVVGDFVDGGTVGGIRTEEGFNQILGFSGYRVLCWKFVDIVFDVSVVNCAA